MKVDKPKLAYELANGDASWFQIGREEIDGVKFT